MKIAVRNSISRIELLVMLSVASFVLIFLDQPIFGVGYTNYTSHASNISFVYPDNWKVNETISFDGSRMTIIGPLIKNGAFLLSSSIIPASELNSIMLDPKSKYSYLYFNYKTMGSLLSTFGPILEEPYSLAIGPYKGESMVYKTGPLDEIRQDWFVSVPYGFSHMISFVSPADSFDGPESKDIRNTFISSMRFLNLN